MCFSALTDSSGSVGNEIMSLDDLFPAVCNVNIHKIGSKEKCRLVMFATPDCTESLYLITKLPESSLFSFEWTVVDLKDEMQSRKAKLCDWIITHSAFSVFVFH